jgi:hypothetical protein
MLIRELFASDVTRDIPPVVYFQDQSPERLEDEVREYIVTGGWPEGHPNRRRVPSGIHEEYVRLLTALSVELTKRGGPDLPNVWISGFYGSGKSSFAKLLGLALDGATLPSGVALAEAWLARDTSPRSAELRAAWKAVRDQIDPIAVVFDVGGVAKDGEHVHAVALRQLQKRLGYCAKPVVADFELTLERDGLWTEFERVALATLGRPWGDEKHAFMADSSFSRVMHAMRPEIYSSPTDWLRTHLAQQRQREAPNAVAEAMRDMVNYRRPGATVFLVIDEVSQYVMDNSARKDALRVFASALGAVMRGRCWMFALGQQKLDEAGDDTLLVWAKDRFPPQLRVHLATTNIRDVVHKRLLHKRPEVEQTLRALFERHRPDLALYAFGCKDVASDEFLETYPLLPGQVDLVLQITSALRARSSRAQGDDQAIRGLLQLLGELFRGRRLADQPLGALVSLDQVYEVQHTALDSETQASMSRLLSQSLDDADGLQLRAAKVVALLQLVQETLPTTAALVAQCLYDRVDLGNNVDAVTQALEALRRANLLGFAEKTGYKLQSSSGEEWERERNDFGLPRDSLSELVREALGPLVSEPERPKLQGRSFMLTGRFSDGRRHDQTLIGTSPGDHAAVRVDLRFLPLDERTESVWVKRSAEAPLTDHLVWVCGDTGLLEDTARELQRSRSMVSKYDGRRDSLTPARADLLRNERARAEDLNQRFQAAVAECFMRGHLYFRGRPNRPTDYGTTFGLSLHAVATRLLQDLFLHFTPITVDPSELMQLIGPELHAPPPKFISDQLGLLELDSGRYVPECKGQIPQRVLQRIKDEDGLNGALLLAYFTGPPYGYTHPVVKACVAGLLRSAKIKITLEDGSEATAVRDPGVRDLFEKDKPFKVATFAVAGEDDIGFQARARIRKLFEERLGRTLNHDDNEFADAVAQHFPQLAGRLREVQTRLDHLACRPTPPPVFDKLLRVLEECVASCRHTRKTVTLVKRHLDTLREGLTTLELYHAELTPDALQAVTRAHDMLESQLAQLAAIGVGAENATNVTAAGERIRAHLSRDRPWQEVATLDDDLAEINRCYVAERTALLAAQEAQAEAARARLKARPGFAQLTADQAHSVLRPITLTVKNTPVAAVAPTLQALRGPFAAELALAEEQANDALDALLSIGTAPLVVRLDLGLRNREVATPDEVKALVADIERRLLAQVEAGVRVRLA